MIGALWSLSGALAVAPPVADVDRGVVDEVFTLTLSVADGETLEVGLGGAPPDTLSDGELAIDATTVVRAVAVDGDGARSEELVLTYLFLDDVVEQDVFSQAIVDHPELGPRLRDTLSALPSVSLVVGEGLGQSEAPVSFEWLETDGSGFQVSCGAARVGGHSINYPKNNFRLYFRTEYGPGRLEADLFSEAATGRQPTGVPPLDRHDSLDLRGGAHDSVFYLGTRGQYLRNLWMDETELAMGHLAPHGRFAHLYLDGVYDGLFHVRERFDAAFLAAHLGGSEDDYAAVNGTRTIDGSSAPWSAIVAALGDYETLATWIDVPQLLDYLVLQLYGANTWDWLYNQNWMAAGPNTAVGGWVFHSSDSDISLYYAPDTYMLDQPGPDYLLKALLEEAHPDFSIALGDALHRNLRGDGPLTADAAAARYARIAADIEDAVVAEAARWSPTWSPDDHWVPERDYLVDEWFQARTDELLEDVVAAGWVELPGPELSPEPGFVEDAQQIEVSVPDGVDAVVWVRRDGGDPRDPGGDLAAEAEGGGTSWIAAVSGGALITARVRRGEVWGPLERGFYEVDEPLAVVLNEWNAVAEDNELAEGDAALGSLEGNGGDWLELLILDDEVDLRGARLVMEDRGGAAGEIVLGDHPVLDGLRAGTLITVAADLPEDLDYDPDAGDWRFHLRAAPDGAVATTDGFRITHREWQLTSWDADDGLIFGPIGEGLAPTDGLSSREVGMLAAQPSTALRRDSPHFVDADASTFGAANTWSDGAQDLAVLRGTVSTDTGDSADPDSGLADDEPLEPVVGLESGCSCGSAVPTGGIVVLGLVGLGLWRRRSLVLLAGCTSASPQSPPQELDTAGDAPTDPTPGGAPEVCNGVDDDGDGLVDDADPDLVDGLPFYEDEDGDGVGTDTIVTGCALGEGMALSGGDCDDHDPEVYPGADEQCDDIDQDCDGEAEDTVGTSEDCAAASCWDIFEEAPDSPDGAYWLALPSGSNAEIWCDMTNGGWTLGFVRNSAATGSQGDFGSGEESLDSLAVDAAEASASPDGARGWHDLNDFPYNELRVAAYLSGTETYRSEAIPRDQLRLAFGDDGYLLYGDPSPYVWCGGDATYTDGGLGAVDNPDGAPSDCRGHSGLGSGWDFSDSFSANAGLTLCGGDGSNFLAASWGGSWISYGNAGGAQAIWVR